MSDGINNFNTFTDLDIELIFGDNYLKIKAF
jgi:hypothetical protein